MHVDVQLYEGRSLDVVTQVETLMPYGGVLAGDYPRYTTGTAMLETAERLTMVEKEPATQQFLLLVGGLRSLAGAEHEPSLILDAFLLRSLAVAGYALSLSTCAHCGAPGPHAFFGVAAGGVLCAACRVAGVTTPAPATLELLVALLVGDWATADAARPRSRREGSGLVAAYLQWYLERDLRSLRMVERS